MADTLIQSSFLVIIWMVVSLCLNTHFIGILFCSSCSISWCWQIRAYATICSGVSSSRTSSPMHNDIDEVLSSQIQRQIPVLLSLDLTFLQPDSRVIEIFNKKISRYIHNIVII